MQTDSTTPRNDDSVASPSRAATTTSTVQRKAGGDHLRSQVRGMSFDQGAAALAPGGAPVQRKKAGQAHGPKPGLGKSFSYETDVELDKHFMYLVLTKASLAITVSQEGELAEVEASRDSIGTNLHAGPVDVGASTGPEQHTLSVEATRSFMRAESNGWTCEPMTAIEASTSEKGPSFALKVKKAAYKEFELFGEDMKFDLGVSLAKVKPGKMELLLLKPSLTSKSKVGGVELSAKLSLEITPDWARLAERFGMRAAATAAEGAAASAGTEAAGAEAAAGAGAEAAGADAALSAGADAAGGSMAGGAGATAALVGELLLPFAVVAAGAYVVNDAWESGYDLSRNAWRGAKRINNYCVNFERACRGEPSGDGDGAIQGWIAGRRATLNQSHLATERHGRGSMGPNPIQRMFEINARTFKADEIYAKVQPSVKASERRALASYASAVPAGPEVLDTILAMSDPGSPQLAEVRAGAELDLAVLERLGHRRGENALRTGGGRAPRTDGR